MALPLGKKISLQLSAGTLSDRKAVDLQFQHALPGPVKDGEVLCAIHKDTDM